MSSKPNTAPISGFPERSPSERIAEARLIDRIRSSFELFGFTPVETCAVERLEVLNAKYNGGLKQHIFRLYNVDIQEFDAENNPTKWEWVPTNLALHFDLTVPLARYVVSNLNSLTFPFRRYQIQKVWRGESPQQKRFREFYQCDIDIIGNGKLSLKADAEIPFVISHVFQQLDIGGFKIGISNRGILEGALFNVGLTETKVLAALPIIDDLPKAGFDKTRQRLGAELVLDDQSVASLLDVAGFRGAPHEVLPRLRGLNIQHSRFCQGISELEEVSNYLKVFGMSPNTFELDLGVIRGLDYYTGTVYETMLDQFRGLSICSGGRYDNLASLFTKQPLPGVGISIGLTRLFEYLRDAKALDLQAHSPTRVLVTVEQPDLLQSAFAATSTLRSKGIASEVYLEERKPEDQRKYAVRKGIPLILTFNSREEADDLCVLRNLLTQSEKRITFDALCSEVQSQLHDLAAIRRHSVEAGGY